MAQRDRAVTEAILEHLELTAWEIVCWQMYGLRVTWISDEVIVETP